MKGLIIKQMQFEYWANYEMLQTLKLATPLNERALLLFSHINSVNLIWLNRIKQEDASTQLFQERTLEDCENLMVENNSNWTKYLQNITESELDELITFKFPIDNTVRILSKKDVIFHITNHSSYHRGQIISLIKGSVENLPMLGYVFFASKISEL